MQALSQEEKRRKLRKLARNGGHASVVEMFKACVTDSGSPRSAPSATAPTSPRWSPIRIAATARRAERTPSRALSCSPASSEEGRACSSATSTGAPHAATTMKAASPSS